MVLATILRGVTVTSQITAIIVAVVIVLLNIFLRLVSGFFALPVTLVTIVLPVFIINAIIILLADKFVNGSTVSDFFDAFYFSILLSFLGLFYFHF